MGRLENTSIVLTKQHGLVAGSCNFFFDLVNFTNERLAKSSDHDDGESNGTLLMCMIINALGFTESPLHFYSNFYQGFDNQVVFGKDLDTNKVNDASFGRLLDALYNYGVINSI